MNSHVTWSLSRGPQLGAAALAVGVTAALLSALQGAHVHRSEQLPRKVMVWLPPLSPAVSAPPQRESRRTGQPTRRPGNTGLRRSAPRQATEPPPAIPPAPQPAESLAPVAPAPGGTAPLNLQLRDVDARSGRASLRSLVDRAGTDMGDGLSAQGRLAQSITRAAKADCLASNEHGSLLSIFKIAYDALTDRCK